MASTKKEYDPAESPLLERHLGSCAILVLTLAAPQGEKEVKGYSLGARAGVSGP